MRCLLCGKWTLRLICKTCTELVSITPNCREIDGFKVYGFFAYDDIAPLLHAKYSVFGSKIYAFLAKRAANFLKTRLEIPHNAYCVGVDDQISKQGYAHNAILLHYFKTAGLCPLYRTLYASNAVKYAGKDLRFREKNPRNFILKRKVAGKKIVLVDDIVTTGLTLKEAKNFLESKGAEVLYALVLANAREC